MNQKTPSSNNPIKRVLIANRGEIAARIAQSIRELGHTAVGLWTDNEPHAAHLEFCHEWVRLKGHHNHETYLNIEALLNLARENNIDAVHPGYGFLSENADFAEVLEENGIIFIGPSPSVIRQMGDKAISKQIAKEAGIPTIPGSSSAVSTINEAIEIAKEITFPVLLKAVAGGGGRGMRVCHTETELTGAFDVVKRESMSAFGSDGLLVEKYIENPRHIEVQVLGDKTGEVYHFFERECSIQRRHQKILEEAPSPFIAEDNALRLSLCETAVRLAKFVGYESVGTVEFIMSEDKQFYFLEMNTRIQVEHPITEEITGIDLIVCMIQVALGEDLAIPSQAWITRSGHAIECRICAEDPITLLPAPGIVTGFETSFPQGIRFDNCLYRGLNITADFDPLVGKLIAKGITRKVAIRKMEAALDALLLEGLKTNIPLHLAIMNNQNFRLGQYSTNFLLREKPEQTISTDYCPLSMFKKIAGIEARKIRQYSSKDFNE